MKAISALLGAFVVGCMLALYVADDTALPREDEIKTERVVAAAAAVRPAHNPGDISACSSGASTTVGMPVSVSTASTSASTFTTVAMSSCR